MKKYIGKWTALLLVCAAAVLPAADLCAAEHGQTGGILSEESEDYPQEDDSGVLPKEEDAAEEEYEGVPKKIREEEPEDDGGSPADEHADSQDGEETGDVDASGQMGEVTEPITKEDKPYLALGANLTPQQQNTVLGLLGINPAELADYDVIYITNEEERQYLGGYVSADKIGTRALSSVLVVKREKRNGINITTKNISYCTIGMYKNALITAGITDADIIVAGPAPISGTAALVGVMKAYSDMTGEQVTEQSMDTALNELVLTGDLADTVGDSEKAEELIAYLKQEVVGKDISSESEIQEVIHNACDKFSVKLSEDEVGQLTELLQKIVSLDLDLDSIKDQAQELYDKLSQIDTGSIFDKIAGFFRSIIDFFKGLFS
ncbi:MAG: DUF1002 domain-containing protein [Lachnospiraceae bacterium]|nr:DUF1002 domain-containing protein [Lachnospiraceae bacterium]